MNGLNYHHLLYFSTVVREGGISKAAGKLRLSQPTISAQIEILEEALGEISVERRLTHSGVAAITNAARTEIFSRKRKPGRE